MNNLNFPRLISASLLILTLGNIANAAPITYTGTKGQYTVDKEAGTYKSCLFKKSCLLLGPNEKIGPTSWKNGELTYSVNGSTVHIYEKNKEIFQDSFVNTPASANKPSTPEVKYGLITPKCIGSACLGMTFGQLKAKLGRNVKYKDIDLNLEMETVGVIQDGKVQYAICYMSHEKLRDKDKINVLVTMNSHYRTKEGVGPGTSVTQAQKIYGKAIVSYGTQGPVQEVLHFSQLPKGYDDIWFKPQAKSGDKRAGIYSKVDERNLGYTIRAKKIKSDAYIQHVMISKFD
jgi:hypothetical protein